MHYKAHRRAHFVDRHCVPQPENRQYRANDPPDDHGDDDHAEYYRQQRIDEKLGNVSLMPANEMPLREAALHYAKIGIPIFPLVPRDKIAFAGSHGYKDATTDEKKIVEWWSRHPNANIGIATGDGAGFFP